MKLKTERYNFAFSKELSDQIKMIAEKRGWKLAMVIEKAMELLIEKEK